MSQSGRSPTTSGRFDYPPAAPSTSSSARPPTRPPTRPHDPQAVLRRRVIARAERAAADRQHGRDNLGLLADTSRQMLQNARELIESLSQPAIRTNSPPADSSRQPIDHSEFLRPPTGTVQSERRQLSRITGELGHVSPIPPGAYGELPTLSWQADQSAASTSWSTHGHRSPIRQLHEANERLQQANSDLRLLLGEPLNNDSVRSTLDLDSPSSLLHLGSPRDASIRNFWYDSTRPSLADPSRARDVHGERSADSATNPSIQSSPEDLDHAPRKRRRLNPKNAKDQGYIREYSWEGQVVPGKLELELLSSDGGVVDNYPIDASATSYVPENVLKDDSSVYCTKTAQCNIILQHRGGVLMTLDTLVITAPKKGYTDPVRDGLVFVADKNDRALGWAATYPISHLPTSLFAPYFPSLANKSIPEAVEVEHASEPSIPIIEQIKPIARFSTHHPPDLDSGSPWEDITPHNIHRGSRSHSTTIKFDPPLGARYILLKLWSPRYRGNIDIQNISAYGYVGPRFFPATEKR